MNAINIYMLTRELDEKLLPEYEKALSGRDEALKIRMDEINLIRALTYNLFSNHVDDYFFDNWFYSFSIPQISKEFDLLKLTKDIVINIELKSQEIPLEKVEKQLKKNRYYLSNVATTIFSFTYMLCNDNIAVLYKYENDSLHKTSFEDLIQCLNLFPNAIDKDIEKLFRPSDYLISPFNTPQKFVDNKYFLTNQQQEIKKEIVEKILQNRGLWGIWGAAGTGKTLLLYDIAKTLSANYQVGIIHCGLLNNGHQYLKGHLNNISIIEAKEITDSWLDTCQIICVDETQRLFKDSLTMVLNKYEAERLTGCIFSYDPVQSLSRAEVIRNNRKRLTEIEGFNEKKLTNHIRTNPELCSFIRNIMRLYDRPQNRIKYDNVSIVYANDQTEADIITRFYRNNDYTLISFTTSRYYPNSIDHYSDFINSHKVIGQEFNNVVIVLDNNFRYNADGELEGKTHPNPDYLFPKLFYQNISRAREKLCLVILNNIDLFEKLLAVKNNTIQFTPKGEDNIGG